MQPHPHLPYNPQVLKTWHRLCHLSSSPLPSSICHGSPRTGLVCAHIPPSFLTLHLGDACMSFLASAQPWHTSSSSPVCLPVKESVVIYVFLPLSFWRFSPPVNERQSVSESLKSYLWCCQSDSSGRRDVSLFMLFICYIYSYHLWRLLHARKNIAIKSASPINLGNHSLFSSCADACIYILGCVSVWLAEHGLHARLDSLFVSLSGLHGDTETFVAAILYTLWTIVLSQVLCSAQVAPAEVSGHQESH